MYMTRRKDFSIFGSNHGYRALPLNSTDSDSARSSDDLLYYDIDNENDAQDPVASTKRLPKRRDLWWGLKLYTPNSSRFANHVHSRLLQKFPFLIEMFYWIITYLFYRMTKVVSRAVFHQDKIWEVAQQNAARILWFEQDSPFSWMFPVKEHDVQQWFMDGHQTGLTFLNRAYALIHIPGTVGFIAWYYYVAPNHSVFAVARRTLTLTNLFAFITFTFYPTMPPRLLPKRYGFLDTVRHDNAQSIWMKGEVVNSLAAMPSMHFGYAFCIGCTMLFHSGIFRRNLIKGEVRKSTFWKCFYIFMAIGYPAMVLSAIVATANHYWLDALMATVVATLAFFCNRVFLILLPLEDYLIWVLRLEKPIPSTGERFHQRGGTL
ncbi:hypothetical protein LTR70_001154 [Exophiala xenobiotica]|uniref:Inositolphosphotransferase Aur1/Ipt1 domain-containing protein n=1 Tax=Lithohypha guttulata TaxID=1690604 RepID=A0ABR0K8C9_9EURO|nr:hypothetical protein LTR24_005739 [Lithohypha guttulata]KAK5328129.1 hypothetical protein LTR70_001154 [Exophiala xenobiotica]